MTNYSSIAILKSLLPTFWKAQSGCLRLKNSATSTKSPKQTKKSSKSTSLQASLRTLPTACHRCRCPPPVHQLAQLALSSQEVGASRWPQQQKELVEASVCSKAPTGRQLLQPPSVKSANFHQAIFYRKNSGDVPFFFRNMCIRSARFQNLMQVRNCCFFYFAFLLFLWNTFFIAFSSIKTKKRLGGSRSTLFRPTWCCWSRGEFPQISDGSLRFGPCEVMPQHAKFYRWSVTAKI